MEKARGLFGDTKPLIRECLAEFLGVYIMILLGVGSMAQLVTSGGTKGDYVSSTIAFALATTFGMYICRGVSGAQLNPAVSLGLCVMGRHQWRKLPMYTVAQVLGSFLGAATVYALYYDAIMMYTQGVFTVTGPNSTARIFSTYPSEYLSIWNGVVDQVIGTAVLMVCVLALGDKRNWATPPALEPLMVGLVIWCMGLCMGSNCSYPLNPARDLGPRVFSYLAGWGSEVFSAGNNWFWVPLVAPFLGALVGSALYYVFIEMHHPPLEPSAGDDGLCLGNKMLKLDVPEMDMNMLKSVKTDGCSDAVKSVKMNNT
ncbi:aquaporin-10-like [Engraulis encrasicolus]|uniref:aquaporin-10-like n=1 Tax=Engraulis encrasicolus TaxID=184585 RepID=UPI002FD52618